MITQMGRDLQNLDDDISYAKRQIKEKLCNDLDIIQYLHNLELERADAEPEDYFNCNIYPFIRIPGTQDKVKNFICFSVDDQEDMRYNAVMKMQYVQFVVFCHGDDIDTGVGIPRHDLLGYFVKDIFNWSNLLGMKLKLVYNRESIMDNDYYCRTLKFETIKPNMRLDSGKLTPQPRMNDEVDEHGFIRA